MPYSGFTWLTGDPANYDGSGSLTSVEINDFYYLIVECGVGGTAVSVGAGTAMSALVGVGSVVLVVGIGVGETAVASLCAISVSMGAAVGDACTVHDVRMNRVMSKLH